MPKKALIVAGVIFCLIALMHLAHVLVDLEYRVAGYAIPPWLNVVGTILTSALAWLMFKAASLASSGKP